jgi:hypothetical protein
MLFVLTIVLALGFVPLLAQGPDTTLTITLNGNLTLISGSDCFGLNGTTATASAQISETSTPISTTSNSATYKIPAGGISASAGTLTFTSMKPWKMKVTLGAAHDTLVLSGPGPLSSTVRATSTMKKGSWTTAVLTNPTPFSPSPQQLTSPGSKLQYTLSLCGTTVLGFNGPISNSAATSELPADDDADQ